MPIEKKAKAAAAVKAKKVKLVRDSFCMPREEYAEIETLKQRLLALSKAVKKSELLRAGVLALARADDASLLAYIDAVPNLKTGRPSTKPVTEPEANVAALEAPAASAVEPVELADEPVAVAPVKRPATRKPTTRKTAVQTS